jgi:pentatricopeptide repeat protein
VERAEVKKLLAVVSATPKANDVPGCVLRTITSIEEREPMSSKQIVHCLTHLLRHCASTKRFKEGVAVFDSLESRVRDATPNFWSLLLYVATEAGCFDRCEAFYARLQCSPGPAGRDFVNVVRAFAKRQDLPCLTATLDEIKEARHALMYDRLVRNRAMGACYKENAVELAVVIANTDAFVKPIDVVGYNTLIACFARAGQCQRSFDTFDEMEAKRVQPTAATFGSLLEACCGVNDASRAKAYAAKIKDYGLAVNAVHCTSLIKALVAENSLLEAEHLLGELLSHCVANPDIYVFFTLMRSFTANANMKGAMRVYKQMTKHGLRGVEFVFNALINGCAIDDTVTVDAFNGLMAELFADGLKPSEATVSSILKVLAKCGAWDEALELLESAPARFNIRVGARLYVQLAQAAIKANCKEHALRIHDAMVTQDRRGKQGNAASRWLLKQCDGRSHDHKSNAHHRTTAKDTPKSVEGN